MQSYNCKLCGAELYWDAKAGCLKCEYCDSTYQVTDFEDATVTNDKVADESVKENEYLAEDVGEGMVG